jgi:DNA-binding transcriptional ArsR family regulator
VEAPFKAIADPNRRRILELVADDELTAGEIAEHFAVTRPAVSQHLSALKRAGLIGERRQGTRRLYRARRQGLAAAVLFVEGVWDAQLGRLRRAAEEGPGSGAAPRSGALRMTERLSLAREIVIAAPLDAVWSLLSDQGRVTRWMGVSAAFDLVPGGAYRLEVVPGQVASGEFVELEPPLRLAHTWGWEGYARATVPPGSTIVSYELVGVPAGTLLRLRHHHLPSVRSAGSHDRGWGHYLPRLASVAAGEAPGPDPWAADAERMRTELRP